MGLLIQQSYVLLLVTLVLFEEDVNSSLDTLHSGIANVTKSNTQSSDKNTSNAQSAGLDSGELDSGSLDSTENDFDKKEMEDNTELKKLSLPQNLKDGHNLNDVGTVYKTVSLQFPPIANFERFQDYGTCDNCFLTTCHCDSLALKRVPQIRSSTITFLDLFNNSIDTLSNKTFCDYPRLQFLILEENKLARLDVDSFSCLDKLLYLNLRGNQLKMMTGIFPKGVFLPLTSLFVLNIQKNNWNLTHEDYYYPDEALAELKNLRALMIDGLSNKTFGLGFGNMTSLRSLSLSGFDGYCLLGNLSSNTFQYLGHLKVLDISKCWINDDNLPGDIFAPLQQLFILDIQSNFLMGFKSFRKVMEPLKNSSLKVLIANTIISRYAVSCHVDFKLADILPKTLVYLEARDNCFEYLDPEVFSILPKRLRYIDVGNNRFVFGKYLQNLTQLENLETLKLDGGGAPTIIPRTYPQDVQVKSLSGCYSNSRKLFAEEEDLELFFPLKLKEINLSVATLKYVLSKLVVNPNNNVEHLVLSNNYFPNISGPFIGFNQLRFLDLSYSSIREINQSFFENFPVLETLILDNNALGDVFANLDEDASMFNKLLNLKYLSLNDNGLTILSISAFKGLDNLETLSLIGNKNWHFNVSIGHMTKLKRLNLTHTEVTGLLKHVRNHIDNLTTGIKVDLSHCPLLCNCENLDFLEWMVRSAAFDGNFGNYLCVYDDTSYKIIQDQFAETLRVLQRRCANNYTLFVLVFFVTLCVLCFVIGSLVYRFRWKIRYLYYLAYRNSREKQHSQSPGTSKYDVFISYASQDEAFVINEIIKELSARGLKLHIHGRDFSVGEYIAANIISAIHESRRTLVVLTRHLLASKWCNYELQMANMESVHTGRPVLVFLLKEPIPSRDLDTDLLYHIRNNTYILYPRSDAELNLRMATAFWNKLATDLRRL